MWNSYILSLFRANVNISQGFTVKIVDSGLYFILFFLSFLFLFFEQLGLGLIGHAVTSVTS